MTAQDILELLWKKNASDLHISSGERICIRSHKNIEKISENPLTPEQAEKLIISLMDNQETIEKYLLHKELDFAKTVGDFGRVRINAFHTNHGKAAAIRKIPSDIPNMEMMGTPIIMKKLCQKENGIILITGPTGSGKSTTLATLINYINHTQKQHILTIEDPIEFIHPPQLSLISQREIGRDTLSFNQALKSAMREDPNVILIGELRDVETIRLALTAAETGHLVLATLHTSSAAKSINRIVNVFPGEERDQVAFGLSNSLIGVLSQNLIVGNSGKIHPIRELMISTPAIQSLIREGKSHQIHSSIQTGSQYGMFTLESSLEALVKENELSPEKSAVILKNLS